MLMIEVRYESWLAEECARHNVPWVFWVLWWRALPHGSEAFRGMAEEMFGHQIRTIVADKSWPRFLHNMECGLRGVPASLGAAVARLYKTGQYNTVQLFS